MKNSIFNAVCKTRYLALLVVLIFTCGNAWGAKDDVVYKLNTASTKIATNAAYGNYGPMSCASGQTGSTLSSANWYVTCGSMQTEGLWLGSNNNQKAKMILSTGDFTEASAIATAIGVATSDTYYAALVCRTNMSKVYKVTLTYTTPGGTAPSEAWILYSTDNGTTWSVGKKVTSLSTSGTDFEFDATVTSAARYAFVIHSSGYCQFKVPVLTFYEGSTSGGTVANPTFSPAAGTLNNTTNVTISTETDGASIRYTTNGTDPTSLSGTVYSSAISVSSATTIKAIAYKDGMTASSVVSAAYTFKCATPTFSPAADTYVGTQSVTISSATDGASIYYTTDGSTPDANSTLYSGAISVSSTQTIKAIAIKSGYTNSEVATAAYTITPAFTVTWKNQGTTVTTTNVASGSKPTFPDMSAQSGCDKYTYFYGWAEDVWSEEVSSPGTSSTVKVYKTASEMPNVSGDVTYHAVWSDTEAGWAPAASISVGDVVLLVNASGTTTYELGGISTTSTKYGLLHEYNTDPDEIYPLTVGLGYNDENYSFKNESDYLYWNSGNSLNVNSTLSTNTSWTVSIDADTKVATIRNVYDNTRYLQYNTGNRFACYTNSCANPMLLKESASGNCVTSCCNQLAAPENPGETPNSTGAVLTWDAVSGATGYEVKIDDGEWTSTGNGTTTGYTITGKTCGGTSVSWQVRATGDGSTNCAEGAATTARNFNTSACACTAYSFHYQHGSDWNTDNICFTAVTGATNNYLTDEMYLPYAEWYKVGWQGADQSYTVAKGFTGTTNNIPMPFYHNREKSFGANPQSGNIGGGKGRFHVYHDSGSTNKYVSFIPTGYTINFGTGDTWSNDLTLNFTGKTNAWDETEWYTEMTTLTDEQIGKKIFVGLQTALGYVWCDPYSQKDNLSGLRTKSGSGESWVSGGMTTAYPNKTGKFRIYADSGDKNWYVTFVPHYQLTYNANGGTGTMNPLPETPVSCEETPANRTVTVGACTFAAPSHKEFKEWNTQADGNGTTIATGSRELTGDLKLYAIWKNESYSISATMTNVTSVTSFPVAYTYTGSAANVTYTFAAASGYRLPDAVTVTGCTYEWDKTTGELTLTGTITGAVSITISGVQTHTVTWKSNGADYVSPVTYDHGASLVLPTPNPTAPSGCSSKVFVGWTARNSEIDTETSTKPTLINPASPGTVTGDVTYRAVFADEVTSTTTVIRYLYTTSISTGKNYIIASSNSAGSVNTATYTGTGNAFTNTSMTVVSGTPNYIAAPANNNAVWSVAAGSASGKYYIQNVGNAGNYIRINGSAANISTDQTDVYFDSDHGVFGKSGSGSTSYSFYYSSGWAKGTFSTSNRNYIFVATEVEVETTTTDKYITLCSTCTTPSNVTAGNISSTGATISWDGVSIEEQTGGSGTGFVVKYGTNAIRDNNNNTVTATSSESSKALTGLTPATQYYAWVQSKCDNSWSETPASFHTAAKITYDKNGGTGTNTSEDVAYNSNVTIKTIATLGFEAPSGKTFNGWLASSAVTVSGSSTTSVADGATISNLTAAITLTAQWRDLAQYHVTFSADNGTVAGGASQTVYENGTLTFPNVTSTTCGTFVGWVEAAYDNESAPSGATYHAVGDELAADPSMDGKTYYAVYKVATGAAETLVDNLVPSDFKATSTSYVATDNLTKTSSAVYQAVTAAGSSAIQINSISDQRGIVTSTSGGTFKGITLTTNLSHSASRKVYVYGSSSYTAAYASPVAFKDNNTVQGTLLATLEGDTKTYSTTTDDYEYIAIFANGAAYLDQISITWYGAPMKYQTSPSCSPMVGLESNFSTFSYVYNAGPSAAQSFTVSGSNLTADLVVTAPTNYEVCKTENGTYSSSVSYTHTDGAVSSQTVYIRLAAGLNAGTYNYTAANGVQVTSTGATTKNAALNGTVTKAAGSIAFTDFNAVDHYEAELTGSSVDVTLKTTVTGDGAISYSRSPAAGSSAISSTTTTATFRATTVGTWTVTATLAASTNYTGTSTTCQVIVYKADRFYDNIHPDVQALMDITLPIEKRGSYTAPDLMDADKGSANCVEKHYKFMGWITKANAEAGLANDDAYKAILIPAGTDMTASGTTYYAVWAEEE